jgi:hypothetical protein
VTAATSRLYTSGDLDVLVIGNGELELAFLPQVGGRLISLRLDGDELLWQNPAYLSDDLKPVAPRSSWPEPDGTMASWANVGGNKSWPAPQGWAGAGEWPGPPDAVLDAGPYEADHAVGPDGFVRVTLTSAWDARTGLRIRREFVLPVSGTSFSQVTTFTNESAAPIRWSVWEVTQVDTASGYPGVFVVEGSGDPLRMVDIVGVSDWRQVPGGVEIPVQEVVGKIGFPGASGRVSWQRSDGLRLEQVIARDVQAPYPDGGCPVELWLQCPIPEPLAAFGGLHPDAHLVEMEVLSPLTVIAPGGQVALNIAWRLARAG